MKDKPRFWQVGGLLAILIVGYVGWMLVVSPVFSAVAQTREETEATDKQTETVMLQTRQLAEQAKDLQEQIDALLRIRAKIPKDVNVPKLMRTIQAEARMEGVELDSLTPGQITLFQIEVTPSPTSTSEAAPDPTSSSEPQPAPTATNLGQGVAPKNTGVAYVPLSLSGQGTYGSIRRLTARLEQQQRAFLVTQLDVARQTDTSTDQPLQFTMEARVFVLNGDEVKLPTALQPGGE